MSFIESVRRHPKVVAGVFSLLTIGSSGCDKSQPAPTTQLAAAAGTATPETGAKPTGIATVIATPSTTPEASRTPTVTPRSEPTALPNAPKCRVGVRSDLFEYIDMKRFNGVGRLDKIDPEDIKTSVGSDGRLELRLSGNSTKPDVVEGFYAKQDERGNLVSRAQASITASCNENNGTALGVWKAVTYQLTDTNRRPEDMEYKVIPNGGMLTSVDGREAFNVANIAQFAKYMPASDPRRQQVLDGLQNPVIVKELNQKEEAEKKKIQSLHMATATAVTK